MASEFRPQRTSGAMRRDFLKASAAGAAAATGCRIARGAMRPATKSIKIGMIGCGGRCSGAAAESLQAGPYVKLVAMCDVFADRVEASRKCFKKQYPDQVAGRRRPLLRRLRRLQEGDRQRRRGADRLRLEVPPDVRRGGDQGRQARLRREAARHRPGRLPPDAGRLRPGQAEEPEPRLRPAEPLPRRLPGDASSGSTTARSATIVAIQSMFLRGPYQTVGRNPKLTETQYQFSNWYHFCWLSGDDVPQSLVHNLDRVSWIMKEEMPKWCFGLAGRSASFGEVYGDMFDHHTVVYEYASGARVYALCRTQNGCYGNCDRHHHGHQGHVPPGRLPHRRREQVAVRRPAQQPLRRRAEGPDRRRSATASRSTAATTWPTARWSA